MNNKKITKLVSRYIRFNFKVGFGNAYKLARWWLRGTLIDDCNRQHMCAFKEFCDDVEFHHIITDVIAKGENSEIAKQLKHMQFLADMYRQNTIRRDKSENIKLEAEGKIENIEVGAENTLDFTEAQKNQIIELLIEYKKSIGKNREIIRDKLDVLVTFLKSSDREDECYKKFLKALSDIRFSSLKPLNKMDKEFNCLKELLGV